MSEILAAAAVVFLITAAAGLWYVLRAPTPEETMLAALLLGTTVVATTVVLGEAMALPAAIDVALVFALLAAILGVTFALRGWPADESGGGWESGSGDGPREGGGS